MGLLNDLTIPTDKVIDPDFYVLVDSHLKYLREHPETQVAEVTAMNAKKYMGDFHGLLNFLNVGKKYHYLVTRLNGLMASTDFDGNQTRVLLPPMERVASIFAVFDAEEG